MTDPFSSDQCWAVLRLALPGWIQHSASGSAPGETPPAVLNQLTGGCGPHPQGCGNAGGDAPDGMCRAEAVGNCLRGGGEILQERLCFLEDSTTGTIWTTFEERRLECTPDISAH